MTSRSGDTRAVRFLDWSVPLVALALAGSLWISGSDRSAFLCLNGAAAWAGDRVWTNVTLFGYAHIALVLLVPWLRRRPEAVWAALLANGLTLAVNPLKELVDRARPPLALDASLFHLIGPAYRTRSFPSGHTATAFAAAGIIVFFSRSGWVRVAALGAAALVGLSRVAIGIHWPSDVLVGAAVGWGCAVGGIRLARRWSWGKQRATRLFWAASLTTTALILFLLSFSPNPKRTPYPDVVPLQRIVTTVCFAFGVAETARLWLNPSSSRQQ